MRLQPNIKLRVNVVNQSSRDGHIPIVIVLHSTESTNIPHDARDLAAVTNWFNNPAAQASAHVITDADGHSARCVPDDRKAWAAYPTFNYLGLHVEQIGFAAQGSWAETELHETARWLAEWHLRHGIPLRRGETRGTLVTRTGVVTHAQLGAAGGGHTDPGVNYPVDHVIDLAHDYVQALHHHRKDT